MSVHAGLVELFSGGRQLRFKKGEIVLRSNDEISGAFLVTSGYLQVYDINDRGKRKQHVIYGPSSCFPMMWVFNDRQTKAHFECMTDVSCIKIAKETLLQNVEASPKNALVLHRQTLKQFRQYVLGVEALTHQSSKRRVIGQLIALAETFGRSTGNGIELPFKITHEHVSQMSDVSRETATRVINQLLKDDLLLISNRLMTIPNIENLQARL